MSRRVPLLTGVVALLLPGFASAALSLNFVGPFGDGCFLPVPFRQAVDLVFAADAASEEDNEGLFAYDLLLTVPEAVRGRFRLDGAEQPTQNFVLDVPGGATFSVAEQDANHILINVASNNNLANIRNGMKAARVSFSLIDPTLGVPPVSIVVFDQSATVFASGDPNRELVIPVALTDSSIVVMCPEPAGFSILAIAGDVVLRRRRI